MPDDDDPSVVGGSDRQGGIADQSDPSDPLSFDMLSASLRADAGDLRTFVDVLATKLADALPGSVSIERERAHGFLHRNEQGSVKTLTVTIGERRLSLLRDGNGVVARSATIVRGITLKTEDIAIAAWVEQLAHALSEEAQRNIASHDALARLLT
ncbi:MAG: hypothetical protein ACYDEY_06810 [Acidimicrobiales bacterium]